MPPEKHLKKNLAGFQRFGINCDLQIILRQRLRRAL